MTERVWWQCPISADHEWKAAVQNIAKAYRRGTSGCPFCTGKRLSVTKKLSVTAPAIADQWHAKKNGEFKPSMVSDSSTRRVWWQCPENRSHVWQGSPYERTREGRTCPYCRGWAVNDSNSLSTLRPNVAKQWHPTRNGKLTPDMVTEHSSRLVWWRCVKNDKHVFQAKICWQASTDKPRCPRCCPRRTMPEKSLAVRSPELATQWHSTLNGDLTPTDVSPHSSKRIWWQCPAGPDHVWQQTPNVRAQGAGCPFCAGHFASSTNSLALLHPQLAAEWHPTKNGTLKPTDVTPGSSRRVWWRCSRNHDHVWAVTITERVQGSRCRLCFAEDRARASKGYSLKTEYPDVAKQWHSTRNGTLTPDQVYPKSQKRVWWQCSKRKSHVWDAVIATRTYSHAGCPFCAGKRSAS
jgi:hypothetical protein